MDSGSGSSGSDSNAGQFHKTNLDRDFILERVEGSERRVLQPLIHKLWSDFSCRRISLSSVLKEVISEQSWISRLSMSSSLSLRRGHLSIVI